MKRARYRGREVRQRNDERKERGLMRKLRKSEVAGKYKVAGYGCFKMAAQVLEMQAESWYAIEGTRLWI